MRSIQSMAALAAVGWAFGAALVAAQKPDIAAHWRSAEISIDGVAKEWEGLATPLTEPKVSMGVANDGDTLYLCLLASDSQTREQILRMGLIVWFDPDGGTRKTFGIKFPVGMPAVAGGRSVPRPSGSAAKRPPEPIEIVDRLEILGPGKDDRRSLVLEQVPGVHVKVGQAEGVVVYELSLPLQRTSDHPYAVGAKPGSSIGLGLATPDQVRAISASGGPPRTGFGGMGGMGGMGGSPYGMGGGEFKPLKPMKTWLKLQLASSAG